MIQRSEGAGASWPGKITNSGDKPSPIDFQIDFVEMPGRMRLRVGLVAFTATNGDRQGLTPTWDRGPLLTDQSIMAIGRENSIGKRHWNAPPVFWAKGFASTSTDDLLTAMGMGRQSLYNAFQDKRALYLEALERYQRTTTAGHLQRLNGAAAPIAGVKALLLPEMQSMARRRMC